MPPRRVPVMDGESAFERLTRLRQYSAFGERAPHKPLLVMLALAQLSSTGTSEMSWSVAEDRLGALLREFGPTSSGGPRPSFPFTRLRSDGVWTLSEDAPMMRSGHCERTTSPAGCCRTSSEPCSAIPARWIGSLARWWHRSQVFKGEPLGVDLS